MGRYRRRMWWCERCGKYGFTSYRQAARVARRLPEVGRVYWSPCGAWHYTRSDRDEYARRRAGDVAGAP